jgi:phage gp29-like protein
VAILDQFGRPFTESVVKRSAPADVFDQRKHDWQKTLASGLTPTRLGAILRANDQGDTEDLLTLAVEMPERDGHLHHLLQVRSFAVAGAPVRAEPRLEDRKNDTAKKISETFQKTVIDRPFFRKLLLDLMDAVMSGYSVIQPVWDTTTTPWSFKRFEHIDPRAFMFDRVTLKELRLRAPDTSEGLPLPPGLFFVHYPQIRSGLPLRGGLARLCAVTWLFKTCTVADWLAFSEVYGMPIRIGRYDQNVTKPEEIETLRQALVNLGHDAAAIIPRSMEIEFLDARRPPSGDNLYRGLAEYFDEAQSKAILGHVISASTGGAGQGPALAEDRREIRQDLREADAQAVSATLAELARVWTQMNYGPDAPLPEILIDVAPAVNVSEFTQGVLPWVRETGLPVPKKWLLNRLQVPEAEPGEEMFEPVLLPGAGAPGSGGNSASGLDGAKRGAPSK